LDCFTRLWDWLRHLAMAAGCGRAGKLYAVSRSMASSNGSSSHCILAIDDEEGFLGLLKAALECEGYTVHTASSPQEAVKFYEKRWREIDVVLLDTYYSRYGATSSSTNSSV
jgi:PleD family two-component response regulator